ncbi:hypothetical protein HMPREF0201_03458 [Cedecea davisae DSM 4568]|uniref:Uncharacterized protein n=1 Tax=Cedecea davisae DSM 4568 TaxID=566551 RepID=S3J5G2_9ENTR|nr:hypothetical protein HMPREF0201_03458 [Cedecea davisae DSM 4568]
MAGVRGAVAVKALEPLLRHADKYFVVIVRVISVAGEMGVNAFYTALFIAVDINPVSARFAARCHQSGLALKRILFPKGELFDAIEKEVKRCFYCIFMFSRTAVFCAQDSFRDTREFMNHHNKIFTGQINGWGEFVCAWSFIVFGWKQRNDNSRVSAPNDVALNIQ